MERFFLDTGPEPDVFIKDEGYAAVKFLSVAAKKLAYESGVSNSLLAVGPTFCDIPCFDPNKLNFEDSIYQNGMPVPLSLKLSYYFRSKGLTVESEFE